MAHFYLSDNASSAVPGALVEVTGAEARHAITVGRLKVGESLSVGDGNGTVVVGEVSSVDADRFTLLAGSVEIEDEPSPSLWLAQALAKNDRDELAIQAATELGVDGVIPWAAARSIVKWEAKKQSKHEQRWQSILREASKQSLRHRIPVLRPLASTSTLAALGEDFQLVVLEPTGREPLSALQADGRDILLIVGPEGGITPSELSRFTAAGASVVSMGAHVLRTSTAGPAAIAVLNGRLHRW